MNLTFRKAVKADAQLLVRIYNAAFYEDYVSYGVCPGYGKTKEEMERSIENQNKYLVMKDQIPVGAISFSDRGNGQYFIGCLCVIPMYQGMGIGTQAFQYMLSICPDWKQISLVTPADKKKNITFYTEKCGFHAEDSMMDGNVEVINLCLSKHNR